MRPIIKITKDIFQNRKPSWLNQQTAWILFVLLILFTTLAWSKPIPNKQLRQNQPIQNQENTPTINGDTSPTPSPSPLPEEWVQNSENTNDIVLVGVLLVLIVVGGTYNAIRQSKKGRKKTIE